jgi:hypothetical protein
MEAGMRTMLIALAALAATAIGCEEPTPCTTNDQCAATEVCAASGCAPALGSEFALVGGSAEGIPFIGPSGAWDTGAEPDPYLVITAGDWTCQTYHATDTLTPAWTDLTNCATVVIDAETRIAWTLWDHDGNDPPQLIAEIAAGEEIAVTAEDLHAGAVASVVGEISVELELEPSPPPSVL